ncbi:hypothetical protein BD414DRAFT_486768 [Trametes punicea]|nr:hypothetical protein BD414DRAFT_486768 [Trametes punicea]
MQPRLVAEDPRNTFCLSTGTISSADISSPSGRSVRVDIWLCTGPYASGIPELTIRVDFDPLQS